MAFSIYDFSITTQAIDQFLNEKLSPTGAVITELVIIGILFLALYAVLGLALIYLERKVCAIMQNRIGPNRVGKWGIMQTIADLIKLLMKELIPIRRADKFLFNLAPFIVIIGSIMAMAALPFAKGLHALDFNIGIFYVMAVSSIGVIGILLAGWSSNSKYSADRGHAKWSPGGQLRTFSGTGPAFGCDLQRLHAVFGNRHESGKRLVDIQGTSPGFDGFYYFRGSQHGRNQPRAL